MLYEIDLLLKLQRLVLSETNKDVRSLRELLIYGLKGMAATYRPCCRSSFENQKKKKFMIYGWCIGLSNSGSD